MSWLAIQLVAALAFALAAIALKLPRPSWTLFGAALLFGLSGYALQGSPGQGGAPKAAAPADPRSGELMVAARKEFYGEGVLPSRYVVSADAFARRGNYIDAIGFLGNAVGENPNDSQAWIALGNALIEHADGQPSDAALFAYERAHALEPGNPAPDYFLGIVNLRNGEFAAARALWAKALATAPDDARYRADLAARLAALDQALARIATEAKADRGTE